MDYLSAQAKTSRFSEYFVYGVRELVVYHLIRQPHYQSTLTTLYHEVRKCFYGVNKNDLWEILHNVNCIQVLDDETHYRYSLQRSCTGKNSTCKRKNCTNFHICFRYLFGNCTESENSCVRSHCLHDEHNVRALQANFLFNLNPDIQKRKVALLCKSALILNKKNTRKTIPVTDSPDNKINQKCYKPSQNDVNRTDVTIICSQYLDGLCKQGDVCLMLHWKLPFHWQIKELSGIWIDLLPFQDRLLEANFQDVNLSMGTLPSLACKDESKCIHKRLCHVLSEDTQVMFDKMVLITSTSNSLDVRRVSTPSASGVKHIKRQTTKQTVTADLQIPLLNSQIMLPSLSNASDICHGIDKEKRVQNSQNPQIKADAADNFKIKDDKMYSESLESPLPVVIDSMDSSEGEHVSTFTEKPTVGQQQSSEKKNYGSCSETKLHFRLKPRSPLKKIWNGMKRSTEYKQIPENAPSGKCSAKKECKKHLENKTEHRNRLGLGCCWFLKVIMGIAPSNQTNSNIEEAFSTADDPYNVIVSTTIEETTDRTKVSSKKEVHDANVASCRNQMLSKQEVCIPVEVSNSADLSKVNETTSARSKITASIEEYSKSETCSKSTQVLASPSIPEKSMLPYNFQSLQPKGQICNSLCEGVIDSNQIQKKSEVLPSQSVPSHYQTQTAHIPINTDSVQCQRSNNNFKELAGSKVTEKNNDTAWKWYHLTEQGWHTFESLIDNEQNSQNEVTNIEKAFITNPKGEVRLQIANKMCQFNFGTLTVTYISNGKQRQVRRRPLPYSNYDTSNIFGPLSRALTFDWSHNDNEQDRIIVEADSRCFQEIEEMVGKSAKIVSIHRIQNKDIFKEYQLKKERMLKKFDQVDKKIQETFLFHGTNAFKVDTICSQNFDCRLAGTAVGHRWGKGVYFTDIPQIALSYCTNGRFVFLARVLVGQITKGSEDMTRPPRNEKLSSSRKEVLFDTTVNNILNPTIFVKYFDHEYYPEYLIKMYNNKKKH